MFVPATEREIPFACYIEGRLCCPAGFWQGRQRRRATSWTHYMSLNRVWVTPTSACISYFQDRSSNNLYSLFECLGCSGNVPLFLQWLCVAVNWLSVRHVNYNLDCGHDTESCHPVGLSYNSSHMCSHGPLPSGACVLFPEKPLKGALWHCIVSK